MRLDTTIHSLKTALLADGVVSLGETSVLMRVLRPFVARGEARACELNDLLARVRRDGVVTRAESEQIVRAMEQIAAGGPDLGRFVRTVPDFPAPGARFRDLSGLFDSPMAIRLVIDRTEEVLGDVRFDLVAGLGPDGAVLGASVAARRGVAFTRVGGEEPSPRESVREEVAGGRPGAVRLPADAVIAGERVLLVGGTLADGEEAAAAARLVERLRGQVVKILFAAEEDLGARCRALAGRDVSSLVKFGA